jgi:hypothetical protein
MPIRTYTGLDLDLYNASFNDLGGSVAPTPSTPAQGIASMFASDTTLPGSNDSLTCLATISITGNFNYDAFPAIPDNALITKIDFSWNASTVQSATATATVGGDRDVVCHGIIEATLGFTPLTDSRLEALDSDTGTGSLSASISMTDNHNNHTIIEFDPPITKAQLETDYPSIFIQIQFPASSSFSANGGEGGSDTANITGSVGINDFNLAITYQSGPEVFTLDPSGGNVEIGSHITVTGPGAAEMTYAAIQGTLVIPIVPKIISPTEVSLEVPYPASDPCFDCIPECPNCDAAFVPCDADLTSQACQDALAECLDCLTECLESKELAEECQESSGNPPETPTPVVIICGGPGFSGSVTLGNFVILVANGSGLYRFVMGKTNDTLYSVARDGTTYDVKIPNPGGKTAFFRS